MEKYSFILKDSRELVIRKATEEDAEKVLEYLNIIEGETDFLSFGVEGLNITLEEERNYFKNLTAKNFFLIAEIEEKIVGNCSISTNEKRVRLKHFGELGIVVLKECWNLGIGNKLIETALLLGKNGGLKKVNLETRSDNKKAIVLYKKLGFKEEGTIKRGILIDEKFYDLLVMGIEID